MTALDSRDSARITGMISAKLSQQWMSYSPAVRLTGDINCDLTTHVIWPRILA